MFLKRKQLDLTQGSLFKAYLLYAIPVIIGTLVQNLFNAADIAVVGQMSEDTTAVAAISAVSTVINLTVNAAIGLAGGATILFAQAIGSKNETECKKILSTSLVVSVVLGVVMAVATVILSPWLPGWVNCPENIYSQASLYLVIYMIGAPASLIYNFGSSAIRVSGDTDSPLWYMIEAGAINLVLNIILCFIMPQKVAAVAIATVLSKVYGAARVMIWLYRNDNETYRFRFSTISYSWRVMRNIMKIGLPSALSTMIFSLGNLSVITQINALGAPVIAGNSAAIQLETVPVAFVSGFGNATRDIVGVNVGAGNRKRVFRSVWFGLIFSAVVTEAIALLLLLFREPLLGIFLSKKDPAQFEDALAAGIIRTNYILAFYFINSLTQTYHNVVNAFGKTLLVTLNNITNVLVLRYLWIWFVYTPHFYGQYENLAACFLVSWIGINLFATAIFAVTLLRYRKGKIGLMIGGNHET